MQLVKVNFLRQACFKQEMKKCLNSLKLEIKAGIVYLLGKEHLKYKLAKQIQTVANQHHNNKIRIES